MQPPIPDNENQRLAALKSFDILDTEPEEAFDRITIIAAHVLQVPIALVSLVDETRQWFKSSYGLSAKETPREIAFCAHTIMQDKPMVVNNALEDPRFANTPLVVNSPEIRFYAGAPLTTKEGYHLGTLCLIDHKARELDSIQEQILVNLASIVVDELELRLANKRAQALLIDRDVAITKLNEKSVLISSMLDSIADGVLTLDNTKKISSFSPAAETIFGLPASAVIGKKISELLTPESSLITEQQFRNLEIDRSNHKIISEQEAFRQDKSRFPVELSITRFIHNQNLHFTVITRDISQRKAAESELMNAKYLAEKSNNAKSDFLSRMSHELRTPLNAIIGFAELIEMQEGDAIISNYVEHILKAGRHLSSLINEVLEISRIEAGKHVFTIEPINLRDVITDTCSLMKPLASERNIKFTPIRFEISECYVIADIQRLKQVFLNLISNAVKYNKPGGKIDILVNSKGDNYTRVSIKDTGIGIPTQNHSDIFEVFTRLKSVEENIEGSGVGLALSKALVIAMNGSMGLTSSVDEGSTFWVDLPFTIAPKKPETKQPGSNPDTAPPTNEMLKKYDILYIEDNISNLKLVEAALSRRHDISLIPAMQGMIGVDLALRHLPNIILLDVDLPDISGDTVLEKLRTHPKTQDTPIIMLSANATEAQKIKSHQLGANDYLTKPLSIKNFLEVVQSYLEPEL